VTRDGKSILAAIFSGDLTRVQSLPRTGSASRRTLFTTTSLVRYLDTGPDGCIYADQVSRPTSLVRFASSGATVHKQSSSQSYLYMEGAALLPNGRLAMTVVRQGRRRLMVIEPGRDPVPLANTAEETATPATAVGLSEVAFMIVETKPKPHREVAIASLLTGRIIRRVAFDKGEITSLAATPDGKMLYCAANGVIWSVPSTSGEPRKIRTGDPVAVDPEGKYLLVQVIENPATRLVRVQLDSGVEQEIPSKGPLHLTFLPIFSEMIGTHARLVAPLASPDSWFFSPGVIDLATGRIERIPVERYCDYLYKGWESQGQVIAVSVGFRSTLWKFQPDSH